MLRLAKLDKFKEFSKWVASLSDLDRSNIITLLELSTAEKVIAEMPEGKNKEMFLVGLSLKQLCKDLLEEGSDVLGHLSTLKKQLERS